MKYAQLIKAIDSATLQLLGRAATVVNQALVMRNWLIGAYIVEFEQNGEDRARYGYRLYPELAGDLTRKGLKGCGERMLQQMAVFYRIYPQLRAAIPQPLVAASSNSLPNPKRQDSATAGCGINQGQVNQSSISQTATVESRHMGLILAPELLLRLPWSHLLELIRLDDPLKRAFYENESLKGNWSKRQLQRQIGSLLYERTGLSKNKRAVTARAQGQEPKQTIEELIRDPYVLEFTGLGERAEYHESDLEQALLDHLQRFLLELGTGFCFEARQFRVAVGNDDDYVDLVFYHRLLRCHVLLDLKTRPFKHADAGQMNYYVNYFKNRVMANGDNLPVGIILCSDRDHTKVEFATSGMDNKLFVSRYLIALPTAEQLSRFIESDRARIEATMLRDAAPCGTARAPRAYPTRRGGR